MFGINFFYLLIVQGPLWSSVVTVKNRRYNSTHPRCEQSYYMKLPLLAPTPSLSPTKKHHLSPPPRSPQHHVFNPTPTLSKPLLSLTPLPTPLPLPNTISLSAPKTFRRVVSSTCHLTRSADRLQNPFVWSCFVYYLIKFHAKNSLGLFQITLSWSWQLFVILKTCLLI